MLSYQHGYHAGGPADMHKHMALAALLRLLTRKPRAISYMETHAGAGLYDLSGEQAQKTGEWRAGLGETTRSDHPFWDVLDAVQAEHGEPAYPGSPLIAKALLRPQDKLTLMELHPAEHATLQRTMAGQGVGVHRRDGPEAVLALSPPTPRRGLVVVDPSYEVKEEYAAVADFSGGLLRRWPQAAVLIWYPLLPQARHETLKAGLRGIPMLCDEVEFAPHRSEAHATPPTGRAQKRRGMQGSGLILLNPPFGAEAALRSWRPD